ncbi:hypothetical protein GCM10027265_26500 [Jatrophihabitans fulvus]
MTGVSDPDPSETPDARGALSYSAPPRADVDAAPCSKVLAQLPVTLDGKTPRIVRTKPDSPFVTAWGSPPVVFRCGVARPAALKAGSDEVAQNAGSLKGPYFFVTSSKDGNVWTSIDRAAYISVTIPTQYQGGDIMPPLAAAIAKALPAVCTTDATTPDVDKLCTRRK